MQQPWKALYIQNLLQELIDSQSPLTAVLEKCDEASVDRLRVAAHNVAVSNSNETTWEDLKELKAIAYQSMKSCGDAPMVVAWMQLYTITSLLLSLGNLTSSTALESLALLDHIIIVCGIACGRLESVHALITGIQRSFLSYEPLNYQWSSPPPRIDPHPAKCPSAKNQVAVLPNPPSMFEFQAHLASKPFILHNFAEDWPALTNHPWCSAAYLKSVSGPGRVVPVEIGRDYRENDWSQEVMSWETFLASLDLADQSVGVNGSTRNMLYLAQYDLLTHFPGLRDDINVPDYIFASIDANEYSDYKPPKNDDNLVLNAWLGPKGTLSPAHTDPYFNFFVQVVGHKTIWLAPPKMSPSMQPAGASSHENTHPSLSMLSNTSPLNVFHDDEPPSTQDLPEELIADASYTTLGPGDMLFIPPGWWHSMRSESTSFSVSMWF